MTYFSTCLNCAADKSACGKRKSISSAIKGLGITSAKFKCEDRVSFFRPGQRVQFIWTYYDDEDHGYGHQTVFVGTVMHEQKGNKRFAVKVDPENEIYDLKPHEVLRNHQFTSVRPNDMKAIDEPDRALCKICAADIGAEGIEHVCGDSGDQSSNATPWILS